MYDIDVYVSIMCKIIVVRLNKRLNRATKLRFVVERKRLNDYKSAPMRIQSLTRWGHVPLWPPANCTLL